jgi:hypothetical protein
LRRAAAGICPVGVVIITSVIAAPPARRSGPSALMVPPVRAEPAAGAALFIRGSCISWVNRRHERLACGGVSSPVSMLTE